MSGQTVIANPFFSVRRVWAMVRRYGYLMIGSWPRLLEVAYWSVVFLLLWGYLQLFLQGQSDYFSSAGGLLICSVLMWDFSLRGQFGFCLPFLEEMFSRNLGHLMVSPLRPYELLISFSVLSFLRTVVGFLPASLIAYLVFDFNIYGLGWALLAFGLILIVFGWAVSMVLVGVIMRYGLGAEALIWVTMFVFLPLCAVYFPVDVLPDWVQMISWSLPPTYVFENIRLLIVEGQVNWGQIGIAAILDGMFLLMGGVAFYLFFRAARIHGGLLQMGE